MLSTLVLTLLVALEPQPQNVDAAPAVSRQEAVQQQQADEDPGKVKREILISFEGNKIFSSGELREHLKYSLEPVSVPRVQTKDNLMRYVNEDLRLVTYYMRSKGYLRASLAEPRIQYPCVGTAEGDGLLPAPSSLHPAMCVDVSVEEGRLFRVGRINIEGNVLFSEQQIRSVIGLKTGDVANGEEIGKALYENLKKYYGAQGFIQYEVGIQPIFREDPQKPGEGIADFDVSIFEGNQFTIRSIKFEGGTRALRDVFRRALLLNEKDIYSQALMEESIDKINELELVAIVDKDRDVNLKTDNDEDSTEVDITIHIKEEEEEASK
jgi:outer membrane protein insertion porin family